MTRNCIGQIGYELTNHLGNVNVVITDRKVVNTNYVVNTFTNSTNSWGACTNSTLTTGASALTVNASSGSNNCIFKQFTTTANTPYVVRIKSAKGTVSAGLRVSIWGGATLLQQVPLADNDFSHVVFTANGANVTIILEPISGNGVYTVDEVSLTPNSIYEAVSVMKADYYPYRMDNLSRNEVFGMPGRVTNSGAYRYGYTGKEQDPEAKGNGNSYDFGARQYDPRLGRWLSLDPLKFMYSQMSPYCYAGNMPIAAKDPDGNLIIFVNGYTGEMDYELCGQVYFTFNKVIKSGKEYWYKAYGEEGLATSEFLKAATAYFDGDDHHLFVNGDNLGNSTASSRKAAGKAAMTEEVIKQIREALEKEEDINFVTHSMGGAYAEGMIEAMMADEVLKKALEDGKILHLSTCDAASLELAVNSEDLYRVQLQLTGDKTLDMIGADNTTLPIERKTEGVTIFGVVKWSKEKYFPKKKDDVNAHYHTKSQGSTFDMIRDLESFRSQSKSFSKWKTFESGGKKYKNVVLDLEKGTVFNQIDYAGYKWKGKGIVGNGKFAGQHKFTREVHD